MTKKALEKLDFKQKNYLSNVSCVLYMAKERNFNELKTEYLGKLHGFLYGLVFCGIITEREKNCLFVFFNGGARSMGTF